jgi:hypothetical protein
MYKTTIVLVYHFWDRRLKSALGPRDLKQGWFPGVHCDVGGGYPEPESGLSKIALEWMVDEAQSAGLLITRTRQRCPNHGPSDALRVN